MVDIRTHRLVVPFALDELLRAEQTTATRLFEMLGLDRNTQVSNPRQKQVSDTNSGWQHVRSASKKFQEKPGGDSTYLMTLSTIFWANLPTLVPPYFCTTQLQEAELETPLGREALLPSLVFPSGTETALIMAIRRQIAGRWNPSKGSGKAQRHPHSHHSILAAVGDWSQGGQVIRVVVCCIAASL